MSAPPIAVEGLEAGYPSDARPGPVLRGLDLRVETGELVALLGPNGSGKTTLLRCLAGTLPAAAGSVRLFGRPVGDWRRDALARRVAVLPQALALPDGFRVAELVEMGRAPHARRRFGAGPEDVAAVERALAEADALDLAERLPAELSGGERQRVLVAMALAQEPELLLLDEPTLHLDPGHQVALAATLERLRSARGLTIVAVLHDLNLARAVAPRVTVLEAGRVAVDGPPETVLSPELVRRLYGLSVDVARTDDGARFLVPRPLGGIGRRGNEPSVTEAGNRG